MLNPGDTLLIARERLRVEALSPRVKLRSLSCPTVTRYPTLAFVEREGVVVERGAQTEETTTMETKHIPFMETPGLPAVWAPATFITPPPPGAYVLTPAELEEALRETVRIAAEYWMTGRHDTAEKAAVAAAGEMVGRLEGEREVLSR